MLTIKFNTCLKRYGNLSLRARNERGNLVGVQGGDERRRNCFVPCNGKFFNVFKQYPIYVSLFVISFCNVLLSRAQTTIKVDVSDNANSPKISKYIYSHFAEHLGRGIYDGFYVGDTSKIPNTYGVRKDVIGIAPNENTRLALAGRLFCRYLPLERWHWAKK